MFIPYISILFGQNLDEESYTSAKIEAVKHLHAVFSSTCGTVSTSNQTVERHGPEVIKLFSCSTQLSMKF